LATKAVRGAGMAAYGQVSRGSELGLLAGRRPLARTGTALPWLYLGLVGHLEGIVDLNAEVTDRAPEY